MFVNHVPKTAGTSLYRILESFFQEDNILTTNKAAALFPNHGPIDLDVISRLSLKSANLFSLIFGHFGETMRSTWYRNHFSIGTCRSIEEKFFSTMRHALREPSHQKRPLFQFATTGKIDDIKALYKNVLEISLLYYYNPNKYTLSMSIDSGTVESKDLIKAYKKRSQVAASEYDVIIDTDHADDHFKSICEYLGVKHDNVRLNAWDKALDDIDGLDSKLRFLEDEFKLLFRAEQDLYEALRQRSGRVGLMRNPLETGPSVVLDPAMVLHLEGFSVRENNYLPGWDGHFVRILNDRECRIEADLSTLRDTLSQITLCFWRQDADEPVDIELSIDGNPVPKRDLDVLFPAYPEKHMFYLRATIKPERDTTSISLKRPDEKRLDFLGGSVFAIADSMPTTQGGAAENQTSRP